MYRSPVGHDALARVLLQLGLPERALTNRAISGLKLRTVAKLAGKKLGAGFFDALLELVNGEKDRPCSAKGRVTNYAFTSMEQITDVEAKGYYAEHIGKEPREKVFATVLAGTREHGRVLLPWNKTMPPWHEGLRQEPKEEVLMAYRTLLRLRQGEKALVYGGFRVLCRRKNRFVYARGLGKRVYVVDCNLGSRPCRPFRLRGKWRLVYGTAETVKDMAAGSGEMDG